MRQLVPILVLYAAVAGAQMQLPPGTSSSVPETDRQALPSAESATLQKAEEAIAANRFAEGVALLTPLASDAQKNGRVFYDLGFAQDALGHDTEAAAAYRSAIRLNPNDTAARVSLGLLLARGTGRAEAEQQLAAAVKTPGADPALLGRADRALAQMHLQSDPEQARKDLIAGLQASPESPEDALLAAEIADALHDEADALAAYRHAQQLAPADPEVALGYARLLSKQKKYAEAEKVLESAREAHPADRELLSEVAAQELLQGNTARAISLLEQLHTASPEDVAVARLLASAYVTNGTPEKADSLFTALLAADPGNTSLRVEYADSLIRQKRSPEAEPILLEVLDKPGALPSPEVRASAEGMLAFAASSNHHPETVLKALAAREAITPSTAPYTFLAATAHDTLRHTRQASEQYHLFLQQAGGKFPDQEWQAQQRLRILDRTR